MGGKRRRSPTIPKPKSKISARASNARKKSKYKSVNLDQIQLPLSNRFNLLDSEMDGEKIVTTTNKVTPIIVTDINIDIQKITKELNVECEIKMVSIGIKIFAQSIAIKKNIVDELIIKNINFFSHPDNENKIFKVILTGLTEIETTKIEQVKKTTYNFAPTKIIMFNTKSHNKLYLCHFSKQDANMKTLNTIKVIYHHIIKWQPFKSQRNSPTQCYRCCMYGHGARSCNRYAVCSLCSGNHTTKECTAISQNATNPVYKCFNCCSANLPHNHKANDVKCPFREKYGLAREKARNRNKKPSPNKHTTNNDINRNEHQYVCAPEPPPMKVTFSEATVQRKTQSHTHSQISSSPSPSSSSPPSTNTFTGENTQSVVVNRSISTTIAKYKRTQTV